MRILAIDSSAVSASVAVVADGKILSEYFLNVGLTHSQTLMPLIVDALKCSGTSLDDVDVFAVTNGPGSFTGVRIGVSTVKGLAMPTVKGCVGVSTLLSMAYGLQGFDGIICAAMDARCGQVYSALFDSGRDGITRLTDDDAVSIDSLGDTLEKLERRIVFVGDGAALCFEKLSDRLDVALLAPENVRLQRASGVAAAVIGEELYCNAVAPQQLSVTYLRPSQAERELKSRGERESK